MTKRVLTKKQVDFIQSNYLLLSSGKLAEQVGCSKFFIRRYLKTNSFQIPKEVTERFRVEGMIGKTTSTPAIDRMLSKKYLTVPEKPLALLVGKSSTFVRTRLRQLGLVIPADIIAKRKADSRIQPGNVSFNKGKKQSEYMSKAAIRRTKATRFKKGGLPPNTKHDLAVSVRVDNRGVKMLFIRISQSNWQPLQRYNWERVNGPIPPKMKVVFRDHNTMNCNVDNLELLTCAQLMKRNSLHNYPVPITRIIQLRGALNRQINKHLKKLRDEKQDQ
jgi:hypothetical protein